MATLKSGLQHFIEKVSTLPKYHKFEMWNYYNCVIGKTIFNNSTWSFNETKILNDYFGITCVDGYHFLFYEGAYNYKLYSEEQWDVIKLFTSYIGECITAEDWLKLANEQLAKMED